MKLDILLPMVAAALVAVIGWYVAHKFSARRDLANKRRELRVSYLIEAYRRLEFASNRPITPAVSPEFEKAIADIQLFGTPTQVMKAQEFSRGFAKNGGHALDPLLNDLRAELRHELQLEAVPAQIVYLRMIFDEAGEGKISSSKKESNSD
jgi:hypothetical protein